MVDAVKILGSLLSSGVLSKGSGGNVLGNLLGAALGGNSQASGMMGMLGGLLGGQNQQAGGGMGGMLGSLLGGGGNQNAQAGGMGGMLGSLLGGGGNQNAQAGGMGGMLGSLLGGGNQNAQAGGVDLGSLLGGAVTKYLGAQNPNANLSSVTDSFLPPQSVNPQVLQDQATLVIRAMVNAAKADGQIDEQEKGRIVAKLGDMTAEEAAFIRAEFQAPLDVNGFIRSIPSGMGQQIYTISLMAIDLDTQQEARYLQQLAEGFNLSAQLCNQIHEQVGAPKIFA